MKVLWFDCETTGLDPVKNDIIQLSGIVEIDREIVEEFDIRMQPFDYKAVSLEALRVTGTTVEQLKTYQTPTDAYWQFMAIIRKYSSGGKFVLAGQNIISFDMLFLREFMVKNKDRGFGGYFLYQGIDLIALTTLLKYTGRLQVENLKLGTIAEKLGIPLQAHDAMSDIRATREATRLLVNKYLKTEKEALNICQ